MMSGIKYDLELREIHASFIGGMAAVITMVLGALLIIITGDKLWIILIISSIVVLPCVAIIISYTGYPYEKPLPSPVPQTPVSPPVIQEAIPEEPKAKYRNLDDEWD